MTLQFSQIRRTDALTFTVISSTGLTGKPAATCGQPADNMCATRRYVETGGAHDMVPSRVWKQKIALLVNQWVALPSERSVRTSKPVSVTAIVCSKWAEGFRSRVTTVHPSESSCVFRVPMLIMGSIAMT